MAATTAPATGTDAPKKKRKAQGPRQARPLNLVLTVDDQGKPIVLVGSYNAQDVLQTFVEATQAGKAPNLVTWTPPAKHAPKDQSAG